MKLLLKILLTLCLLNSLGVMAAERHQLTVHLTHIKNDQGHIYVELYSDSATFRKSAKALKMIKMPAKLGAMTVVFTGLESANYAILSFHDEDENGQMNKRFGMIPTEGYGLSNNPKVMGPPAFKESAFEVDEDSEVSIQFNY
jgi:uncharacterized protein (DUF2141 family)